MPEDGYAKEVLVTTEWLAEHLSDDGLVVAEVDESPELYDEGHIPGAVKLHWRDDLQDPVERDIVDRETFEALLGSRGIGNDTSVDPLRRQEQLVRRLRLLVSEALRPRGRPHPRRRPPEVDRRGPRHHRRRSFPGRGGYSASEQDASLRAYRDQVLEGLGDSGRALVDVRSPGEYAGDLIAPPGYEQEGAQRGGHIPTAASVPWATAVADDGTFKTADELREIYGGKGVTPDKEVTAYCRIGERSAHTWFVLRELLGYENVRNYDGSWTEWGNLVDVPIERGA